METILSRRKLKRNYEYEVQWKGMPLDKNEWLTRDQLEEMGFTKALNDIDIKEAAKQGLVSRPLTGLPLTTSVQSTPLPCVLSVQCPISVCAWGLRGCKHLCRGQRCQAPRGPGHRGGVWQPCTHARPVRRPEGQGRAGSSHLDVAPHHCAGDLLL